VLPYIATHENTEGAEITDSSEDYQEEVEGSKYPLN
jgi:hypothetical protein